MNTESLNKLSALIHQGNVDRGFYDGGEKEIGTQLMLVVSELGEALEADRKGRHADMPNYMEALRQTKEHFGDRLQEGYEQQLFKTWVKDTFEDEIADTFIRLFDIVGWLGIDIENHIEKKLEYNATRGYKHGKKY